MDPAPAPSRHGLDREYRYYLSAVTQFHLAAAEAGGLHPTDYQASSILDLDGPLTSGQLSARLGLSPSATTRVIDRLIRAGIAERTRDDEDRRRVMVAHTGHLPSAVLERLGRVREPIARAVAGLSEEQRQGLAEYFRAAAAAYRDGS